jgi:hypothetical protein
LAFNPSAGLESNGGKQFGMHFNCSHLNRAHPSVNDCRQPKDTVDIVLKNFGVTPALHAEICSFFQHAGAADSYDVESAFELNSSDCVKHLQKIRAISPTEAVTNSIFFTAESLDWLKRSAKGDGVTFLISRIDYSDVFGDSHSAHLCAVLNGKIGPGAGMDCGGRVPEDY